MLESVITLLAFLEIGYRLRCLRSTVILIGNVICSIDRYAG
jgi:hypothetical protein